ncbi:MAG: MFS transporter [Chloroflexi bacterium]|nr:MFS transporter [Chloroflexota bacterium]
MIRNHKTITASSFGAMFFLGVGASLIGAAARNLGLTASQIGLLIAAQNVGFMLSVFVAGALADTHSKPRILCIGSLILAGSFFTFYLSPAFGVNLAVMFLSGAGIGTYEGVADALLLDLHEARAGLFINVNHFFVTIGGLLISLYLIFLALNWRTSVVQSGIVVLLLAVIFGLTRLPKAARSQASYQEKLRILASEKIVALLFIVAVLIVGVEMGSIGILSTFLAEVRGFGATAAKLGLVVFLGGMAAGRLVIGFLVTLKQVLRYITALLGLAVPCFAVFFFVDLGVFSYIAAFLAGMTLSALLPLVLTFAGSLYKEMSGTVLGTIKVAIPLGGIVTPLALSLLAGGLSLQASLAVFPLSFLAGFLILLWVMRLADARERA